jgi:hypothetical protein
MNNPEPLIAQIVARVPSDRAQQTTWHPDPQSFAFRFYEPWTPPRRDSLPKALPDNLFDKPEMP